MIGPFNFKKLNNKVLITNDLGRYEYLSKDEFSKFINKKIDPESELYCRLKDKMFLFDDSIEYYVNAVSPHLRSSKSYLYAATSLHIFVVSNYCNSKCIYCQAQSNQLNSCKMMTKEIARKAVDFALQSPQKELNFEFQGGEPLSNFPIIKYIVEYTKSINKDKKIQFSLVSNLSLLTDEMVEFFKENQISISTSLDGHEYLHNYNRPLSNYPNTYQLLTKTIHKLKENHINYGAIQTTTKESLQYPTEIIEEYRKKGLDNIFIRPLTPLGYALEKWDVIGYSVDEFIDFYRKCLNTILEINKQGIFFKEGHAAIFLSKILDGVGINYMELRSPCGAAVGQLAYYYDGNIYTCDEGRMLKEMGDESFKVGNVFEDTYDTMAESKITKTVCKYSILEGLPQCSECAYLPYCGTCPVINYALEKDIVPHSIHNYRCQIYKGMLDVIFELLQDEQNREVFRRWIS